MSIDLITACRRRLDVTHGELLVAIELADAANDNGDGIFVGVARLADRSRQDPRTVQRQLKRLRDVGWLQVVQQGGGTRADGSGIPTQYRISAAWVKGDILPGFADFVPKFYDRDKGGTLSPHDGIPRQNTPPTVTKGPTYPDTAVSPDPLTRIPSDARARAIPSGSRATQTPEEIERRANDERQIRSGWSAFVQGQVFALAWHYGAGKFQANNWDDITLNARGVMQAKCRELVERAMSAGADIPPTPRKIIEQIISDELVSELKRFRPATPAEQAAAAHAA